MYGPLIFMLCARPGDDLIGASGAILRAREEGCKVVAFMASNGLLPPPTWKFWGRNQREEEIEAVMGVSRRIAYDYGHHFVSWDTQCYTGQITAHIDRIAADIQAAFVSQNPDIVWVPAFLGLDPDYDALNVIASRLPALSKKTLELYEYLPRPIQHAHYGADKRAHMVFPTRQGIELPITLTLMEASKKIRAADRLAGVYKEKLHAESDRELFRVMPRHDYTKPPYSYKNAQMLRGHRPHDGLLPGTVAIFNRFLHSPSPSVNQHHLPES